MTSQFILLYVLKTILVSGIFFGYYWFALRDKKFHYYNRFYLLACLSLSLIIPLLNFNWFTVESPVLYGSSEVFNLVIESGKSRAGIQLDWMDWSLIGIALVGMGLLLLLGMHILKIFKLKQKAEVVPMDGFDFISIEEEEAPFSFLDNLFWKKSISLNDNNGQKIFKHDLETSQKIMMTVHTDGSAIAGVYSYEIAEQKGVETTVLARNNGFPLQVKVEKQ